MNETLWSPLSIFNANGDTSAAFILLNQPINDENESFFKSAWANANVRLCADGAANRLFDWAAVSQSSALFIPEYICGDLDSLRDEVRSFYANAGTRVIRLHNQDLTDFYKTLKFAMNCIKRLKFDKDLFETSEEFNALAVKQIDFKQIYILCNFSGRFDHALSNIHSLYKINCEENSDNSVNVFLLSEESISFVLNKGVNYIFTNSEARGTYCGYFPLSKPTVVTTKGLKWDLDAQLCSFERFISSSNEFTNNEKILVETESPLLWTMSLKKIKL